MPANNESHRLWRSPSPYPQRLNDEPSDESDEMVERPPQNKNRHFKADTDYKKRVRPSLPNHRIQDATRALHRVIVGCPFPRNSPQEDPSDISRERPKGHHPNAVSTLAAVEKGTFGRDRPLPGPPLKIQWTPFDVLEPFQMVQRSYIVPIMTTVKKVRPIEDPPRTKPPLQVHWAPGCSPQDPGPRALCPTARGQGKDLGRG